MYIGLHVKYPLFLSDFSEASIFLTDFRQNLEHQISWKSAQWEPELLHADRRIDKRADRQTDKHDEERSRFSQNFLDGFSTKPRISNFVKIRPVGARVVPCGQTYRQTGGQADRQTWRRKKSLFAKVRKAPKIAACTNNATQSNRCASVNFKRCSQRHLTIFQVPSVQQGANWCRTEKLTVSFFCRNCYVIKNCIQFCWGLENTTWATAKYCWAKAKI